MRNSISILIRSIPLWLFASATAFAQMPAPPDAHKVLSEAYTGKSF